MTKRRWTWEKEKEIRYLIGRATRDGIYDYESAFGKKDSAYLKKMTELLMDVAPKHITLGKMIDFSCTVDGLHRAGQDDWDAHAIRFNNRIIRVSTRVAADVFGEGEVSDYYKDKIIPTAVALQEIGFEIPDGVTINGMEYEKTVNGYIRKDLANDQDVKRGLYMLSIPSTFIFKCNISEFAHVYKQRNKDGHANPEVKECAETITDQIIEKLPFITREWLLKFDN